MVIISCLIVSVIKQTILDGTNLWKDSDIMLHYEFPCTAVRTYFLHNCSCLIVVCLNCPIPYSVSYSSFLVYRCIRNIVNLGNFLFQEFLTCKLFTCLLF